MSTFEIVVVVALVVLIGIGVELWLILTRSMTVIRHAVYIVSAAVTRIEHYAHHIVEDLAIHMRKEEDHKEEDYDDNEGTTTVSGNHRDKLNRAKVLEDLLEQVDDMRTEMIRIHEDFNRQQQRWPYRHPMD